MASDNPYGSLSSEVNKAFEDLNNLDESQFRVQREAEELFNLPDGVQIFFISSSGKVSTFSEPSSLRIFRFKDLQENEETRPTFIQVNGWTHPLVPGYSPVLEAGNGAFMFPDVYSEDSGAAVGVVISDDSVYNVDGEAHAQLAQLLLELTALQRDSPLSEDQRLGKIGRKLVKGAELLTQGLEYGAEKASKLIEYVGEKERQKAMAKEGQPGDKKVSSSMKSTIKGAKLATNATVQVSGFVANRVGKLTKGLANYLADKMEKPVTDATGVKKMKSSSMHNIVDAARGGLLAYGTVYAGLENSAKVLGKSVKENTVTVVKVKYGGDAAEATEDAITAAGNAAMTYMNVQSLGVKGLAKKTAKETGKSLGKKVLDAHSTSKIPPEEKMQLE